MIFVNVRPKNPVPQPVLVKINVVCFEPDSKVYQIIFDDSKMVTYHKLLQYGVNDYEINIGGFSVNIPQCMNISLYSLATAANKESIT